jgi:hypothetical protein
MTLAGQRAYGPPRDVQSEAWMKVVTDGRALQWGAPGPDDYHGELAVDPGDDESSSRLTVRLHTDRSRALASTTAWTRRYRASNTPSSRPRTADRSPLARDRGRKISRPEPPARRLIWQPSVTYSSG